MHISSPNTNFLAQKAPCTSTCFAKSCFSLLFPFHVETLPKPMKCMTQNIMVEEKVQI